jgi:hypothetical protein
MSSRNDISGNTKVLTKVGNSLRSEVYVVVLPRKGNADVSTGLERFDKHENFEVGGSFNVGVSGRHSVLLDHKYTLSKEVFEYSNTVSFWDKHD